MGSSTLPAFTNSTFVAPYQVYQLETALPIDANQYTKLFFRAGSDHFIPPVFDQKYKLRQTFNTYDVAGNVLHILKEGQSSTSFLWDYSKTLIVAKADNAAPNQIAYAGFEADVNGLFVNNNYLKLDPHNWDFDPTPGLTTHIQSAGGFTGRGCYRLDGGWSLERGNLPEGNYEVCFWARGGLDKIYIFATQELSRYEGPANTNSLDYRLVRVRVHVAAGSSIKIDAYGRQVDIDEVRLYPVGAQMTTYTHDPLVGVTSMSDVNCRPTFYEYDGLQRLKVVRDAEGNITKHFEYRYQQ